MRYPDKYPVAATVSPKNPQLIIFKFETILTVSFIEERFYRESCRSPIPLGSNRAAPSLCKQQMYEMHYGVLYPRNNN